METGLLLIINVTALVGLLHFLFVPSETVDLGSLSQVTDSVGTELLETYYPIRDGQDHIFKTSMSTTHYFMTGRNDGRKIVLVHGINVTGNAFPEFIERLTALGFLVLSYDLYGMGYSGSPGTKYDEESYTLQLVELLKHVGWSEPVVVLGFSLGGGIATCFADKYPEYVEKLVLIAPAGLKHNMPMLARIFDVPYVGETLFYLLGMQVLVERGKKHLKGSIPEPYKVC
ncbi:hypothetical protein HDU83_009963 [Entophlyctis luteolus]|nr:hypothetical protein HDU82_006234 [Entophlyctis luteolus]KAJ3350022.1 hypothetical protein HDU83_009963 [Entophlyctis luteolus]KAJ3386669.1 hypothetical protein HDU84_001359 [Entophlyctis sp. JEL0112]